MFFAMEATGQFTDNKQILPMADQAPLESRCQGIPDGILVKVDRRTIDATIACLDCGMNG